MADVKSRTSKIVGFAIIFGAAGVLIVLGSILNLDYLGKFGVPSMFATATVLVFYGLSVAISGHWNPLYITVGADGRLSASKFQFFLWTATVAYVFVLLYCAFVRTNSWKPIADFPTNVLIAMGFSVATAAGAKGITVSYIKSGQISKPATNDPGKTSGLVAQDNETIPDLTKIQMLIWTLIAVVTYLVRVYHWSDPTKFPDIEGALMVLMGLSQGAYLGNKLVTSDTPRLYSISLQGGPRGQQVTINGDALGSMQAGSIISINGQETNITANSWADNAITFNIPRRRPDGINWKPKEKLSIGLIIGGRASANQVTYEIADRPMIQSATATLGGAILRCQLIGSNFGLDSTDNAIVINGQNGKIDVKTWQDARVEVELSNTLPNGATVNKGDSIGFAIAVAQVASDEMRVKLV